MAQLKRGFRQHSSKSAYAFPANFVQSPCVRRNPEDLLHWRFPDVLFIAYRGSDSLCLFHMVMCVGLQSGVATRNCIRSLTSRLLGNTEISMIRRFPAVTLFTLAAVLSIIRMCCLLLFKNASRQFRKFPRRFFFEIGVQFGNCRRMIVEPKQYLRF